MWKILHNDFVVGQFDSLTNALEGAKLFDEFVTITDGTTEFVGKFGYDEVKNGKCPDGVVYDWTMRRDETHRSSRKKLM